MAAAAERRRRSKATLEAVIDEVETCLPNVTKPEDARAYRELVENGRNTLARQNGRLNDDQADADLLLAQKMWTETRAACPSSSEKSQAIGRVLERIAEK